MVSTNVKNMTSTGLKCVKKQNTGPIKHKKKQHRWHTKEFQSSGGGIFQRVPTPPGTTAPYFLTTGTNRQCNFLLGHKQTMQSTEVRLKILYCLRGQEVYTSHNFQLWLWQLYGCLVWLYCKWNKQFNYLNIFPPFLKAAHLYEEGAV